MLKELIDEDISQEDILRHYNANITYKPLPCLVDGLVFHYKGINNIIVNKNLSHYRRQETLLHELAHIELNQLCQIDRSAFKIKEREDEADRYIKFITEKD